MSYKYDGVEVETNGDGSLIVAGQPMTADELAAFIVEKNGFEIRGVDGVLIGIGFNHTPEQEPLP